MHWWPPGDAEKRILAGKDEIGGGTWFGVSEFGKWGAVTNFREPHPDRPNVRTRGELVTDFLLSDILPSEYLKLVNEKKHQYSGFNLLVSDGAEVYWYSNRAEAEAIEFKPLAPGVYGLCNHLLNTPWPKVQLAKENLGQRLESKEALRVTSLLDTLHDESRPPDDELPSTGVKLEAERILSSMFINSIAMDYGTRCSTAMTITGSKDAATKVGPATTISVAEMTYPSRSVAEFRFKTS